MVDDDTHDREEISCFLAPLNGPSGKTQQPGNIPAFAVRPFVACGPATTIVQEQQEFPVPYLVFWSGIGADALRGVTPKTDIRAAPQSPPVGDVTLGFGTSCLDTRHCALTWLSQHTPHGTNVMGMYTAFRSMIVVSLWLSARCAKRGSRLCGGGTFLSIAGNARPATLPQRKPSPWRARQVSCPRGQQPPSWLTQSGHQPPPVRPTRRGRDEARLVLTITVGLLAARCKLPTMASEPLFHMAHQFRSSCESLVCLLDIFPPKMECLLISTCAGVYTTRDRQGSSLAGLTLSDEPPLITKAHDEVVAEMSWTLPRSTSTAESSPGLEI